MRLLSFLITGMIAFAAIWFIWPMIEDSIPRALHKWTMAAIAIVCLLPQFILQVFFAPPFDVTAYSESVDYEFASKEYAVDFAMENIDAPWVKVDGQKIK